LILLQRIKDFCEERVSVQLLVNHPALTCAIVSIAKTQCVQLPLTRLSSNPKGFLNLVRRRALPEAGSGTARMQ
jgi:hypothetical protein